MKVLSVKQFDSKGANLGVRLTVYFSLNNNNNKQRWIKK